MSTAATSFPERNAAEVADLVLVPDAAAPQVRARRARQRRQMYIGQVASYSLGAFVLLLYGYDGAVAMNVPSLFWVGGLSIIGIFVVMSEAGVGDRQTDHYLTCSRSRRIWRCNSCSCCRCRPLASPSSACCS